MYSFVRLSVILILFAPITHTQLNAGIVVMEMMVVVVNERGSVLFGAYLNS